MAENEKKKLRAAVYCRVGRQENLGPCNGKECGSPARPVQKGAEADAHTESCDICKGFNRA